MIKQPARKEVKYFDGNKVHKVGDKVIVEEWQFDGRTSTPVYTRATIIKINRVAMLLEGEDGALFHFDCYTDVIVTEEDIAMKAMARQAALVSR